MLARMVLVACLALAQAGLARAQQRLDLPTRPGVTQTVWLSAVAARIGPPSIAGVVLTSSVWSGGMASTGLAQISVPVLVVHNRDDSCAQSPFASTDAALAQMVRAPVKQLITVSGGISRSQPCEAMSPHGYLGIEDQVVPPIVAWIKSH